MPRRYFRAICPLCDGPMDKRATTCRGCLHAYFPPRLGTGTGFYINGDGYRRVVAPRHPQADKDGFVLEHRLVMEGVLGRLLISKEHVHHINGDRADNREENLQLTNNHNHGALHVSVCRGKTWMSIDGKRVWQERSC